MGVLDPVTDVLGIGGDTSGASQQAADIQAGALQRGLKQTQRAGEQAAGRVQPFVQQGQRSIQGLRTGLAASAGTLLPSSAQALQEGSRALNRAQAATGKLKSGEGQIQFSDFIANVFNRDRDEKIRRAEGIRGVGLNQIQSLNALGFSNAARAGALLQGGAGINASLIQQQAQAEQARGAGIGGLLGAGAGFAIGGPAGAAIGAQAGSAIGGGAI